MNDFMMAFEEHSSEASVVQAAALSRVWSLWRKPSVCPTSCVRALFQSPLLKSSVQLAMPWFISTSASCVVKKVSPFTVFVPEALVIPPMPSVPL